MILSRTYTSCLVLGGLIATPFMGSGAMAGDELYGQTADRMPVQRIGDNCARFGQGFVDMGNGVCGRVTAHVRVYVGSRNATLSASPYAWTGSGTSSAALRSDGMLPGAEVSHLRVRGSLDSPQPFP